MKLNSKNLLTLVQWSPENLETLLKISKLEGELKTYITINSIYKDKRLNKYSAKTINSIKQKLNEYKEELLGRIS